MVRVASHPTTGAVITVSTNNPEYGTIRLDEETIQFQNNFMNKSRRSVFIRGKVADLESLGYKAKQALAGKIIKRESFEPFYEGQEPKMNPTTQEVVLKDNKPVYLEFIYTLDAKAQDVWVESSEEDLDPVAESAQAEQNI